MKNITFKACFMMMGLTVALSASAQQKQPKKAKAFGKGISVEAVKCASTEYEQMLQQQFPKRATTPQFEQWLAPKVNAARAQRLAGTTPFSTNTVVTIPVVVHVVHNGDPIGTDENLAVGQILSQITVLNQDFRRMANTPGFNTNSVGADVEIEFCLAQQDPDGIASTGITRHNLGGVDGWDMESIESTLKPQTQWDPEKYLNIWVVDYIYIGFGELAGYAQFPTMSGLPGLEGLGLTETAETDGVVIAHKYFGSSDIYPEGTYDEWGGDKGRSATHEVGHFFGLRHIWGDGDCSADDFCADTPVASEPNSGCDPVDTCPASPGMDMIENYMDYTSDTCKNVFTLNQKDRIVAVLANSPRRVSLITSPGCTLGVVPSLDGSLQLPGVNSYCSTTFEPNLILTNNGSTAITTATISYSLDQGAPTTYSWTGNLAYGDDTTITLPTQALEAGAHTFNATLTLVNGVADEISTNNSTEIEMNIATSYATANITVTVMTDEYGDETIWALLDSDENPIVANIDLDNPWASEFYNSNQLYTQTVPVAAGECYIFAILDLAEDGICCEFGQGYYTVTADDGTVIASGGSFTDQEMTPFSVSEPMGLNNPGTSLNGTKLYPNPANSILNISMPSGNVLPENFTVYNSLGQVVNSGKVTSADMSLDISGFANGVYIIKLNKGNSSETMRFVKY